MIQKHLRSVCRFGYALGIFLMAGTIQSCSENEFPVTPVPGAFEFIPPDDVYMLAAQSSDGEITLSWNAAPDGLLKAIHITNQTTGETKDVAGNADAVSFTGLTNYQKYTFLVRTESQQEQLSYGVTVSAKPFRHDETAPDKIANLQVFRVSDDLAYAEWDAPADDDVENYVITLGESAVTVSADYTFGTIRGNLAGSLSVHAVDYSGNKGAMVAATGSESLLEIAGWDTGDEDANTNATEYVTIKRNPLSKIDKYVISYTDPSISRTVVAPEVEYSFDFPLSNLNAQKLWFDTEKTIGNWTIPIAVDIYREDVAVASYEYRTYNNIPGTLMLCHCNYITGGKQNNDGKCYDCVVGNTEDKGCATFDVNVLEDGEYDVYTYFSNGDANREFYFYLDDKIGADNKLLGGAQPDYKGTEGFKTGGWNDYQPAKSVVTMHLTKGAHKLAFYWPQGGHNFKKLVFTKK